MKNLSFSKKTLFVSAIILILTVIMLFFYLLKSHVDTTCKRQLADFYPLIINYSNLDGKMPACFNDILEPWKNDRELFGCPEYLKSNKFDKSMGYILVPWKCRLDDIPEDAPLVYDKTFKSHHNGVYVLTAGSGVKFIEDKKYFIKFKKINPAVIIPTE